MSAAEDFNPRALIPCERIRAEAFYVETQSVEKTDRRKPRKRRDGDGRERQRVREQTTQLNFKNKSLYIRRAHSALFIQVHTDIQNVLSEC